MHTCHSIDKDEKPIECPIDEKINNAGVSIQYTSIGVDQNEAYSVDLLYQIEECYEVGWFKSQQDSSELQIFNKAFSRKIKVLSLNNTCNVCLFA